MPFLNSTYKLEVRWVGHKLLNAQWKLEQPHELADSRPGHATPSSNECLVRLRESIDLCRKFLCQQNRVHPLARLLELQALDGNKLQAPVPIPGEKRRFIHKEAAIFGSPMVKVGQPIFTL